jgi:hypothetical protein
MLGQKRQSRLFGTLHLAVLVTLASAATAQGLHNPRYPISGADIARELGVVGVNVNASQVRLPANMSAASASPKLEIVTVQPVGDNQVRLGLRCPTAGECLPFLATADVKDAIQVTAEIRVKTGSPAAVSHQATLQIAASQVSQPRLTVGSQAVLIIRDGHLDIHLQVLAIDSGEIGQRVRVCTLDRKKVFHATVNGVGTVTGVME